MHYCGIVPAQRTLQLAMLEEVRAPEPPIRLSAIFFEPGSADQVAAELRSLGDVVVGIGAPLSGRHPELERRGVPPLAESSGGGSGGRAARTSRCSTPTTVDGAAGAVPEGTYHEFPLFETNADGVF